MKLHIDLCTMLHTTVCDLYSNLVTRPTGAAIRVAIEKQVLDCGAPVITTIDFSKVNLLDFSCADEIVAKLLLRYSGEPDSFGGYILFRGIQEAHLDPIETVLARRNLALVSWQDDGATVLGCISDAERRCWNAAYECGPTRVEEISSVLGMPLQAAAEQLGMLVYRRLLMESEDLFLVPGAPLQGVRGQGAT